MTYQPALADTCYEYCQHHSTEWMSPSTNNNSTRRICHRLPPTAAAGVPCCVRRGAGDRWLRHGCQGVGLQELEPGAHSDHAALQGEKLIL